MESFEIIEFRPALRAPQEIHTINVLRIIDELEQLVEEGKGILGKRLVPEEDFFSKVQQLRSALPKSMKEAEDLMKKAEAVVRSAQAEADRLIDTAERDAEKLVADARNRSERAIGEAKNHADRLTNDAQLKANRTVETADAKAARTIEAADAQAARTIDEANDRAAHIEANAQKLAETLVADNAISKRSQEEADARLDNANAEAEELRRHADDYAFEVLDKISGALDKLNTSVEAGKESLRANSSTYGDDLKDPYAPAGNYANSDFNGAR